MEAFAALGYKPEQVTTILLTHKHGDHSGKLRSFPNAKIYVNEEELSAEELQGIHSTEHNTHRLAQPNFQFIKDISGLPHCHQWRREPFMKKRRNFRKRNPPCRRAEGILYLGVITMFDPEGFIQGSGT